MIINQHYDYLFYIPLFPLFGMKDENIINFLFKVRKLDGENIIIIPKEYDEKIKNQLNYRYYYFINFGKL